MYLYKRRYCKPGFSLLTDLKKQYRNQAILKPVHFEPMMATPVIRDQHPGDHKKIRKLAFAEDAVVKQAYNSAKRSNPYYTNKSLEHFSDIQTEIMQREKVDREEAYELAQFELGRQNRLADLEAAFTLGDAERFFGIRLKPQSTFFTNAAEETTLRLTRERIYEIANMRLNGVRQDEIDRQISDLGLTKEVATRLVRKYGDLREFFEEDLVEQMMQPDPLLLTERITLAHTVDPAADEGAFPLHESDYASEDVLRTELEFSEAGRRSVEATEKRSKKEKLTPRMQEQKRIEYQKMRTLKRQRK